MRQFASIHPRSLSLVLTYTISMKRSVDVLVIGAGHNGLVAALLLARKGLDVLVVEEKPASKHL